MKRVDMTGHGWTFDYLPDSLADLGIEAVGVIHVGAHLGEEVPVYRQCGFGSITLVEPDPLSAAYLRTLAGVNVIEAAVMNGPARQVRLNRTANTMFSGVRPIEVGREVTAILSVRTTTLRAIQREAAYFANVLVVDTQGTELDAIDSANLTDVDLVIMETQEMDPSGYAAYWPEAVEFMGARGYIPAIRWDHEPIFADTLFVKRSRP